MAKMNVLHALAWLPVIKKVAQPIHRTVGGLKVMTPIAVIEVDNTRKGLRKAETYLIKGIRAWARSVRRVVVFDNERR